MAVSYKGFSFNNALEPKPWGARELQVFKDLTDTLVTDACVQEKQTTNGHRHYRVYTPNGASALITGAATAINFGSGGTPGMVYSESGAPRLAVRDSGGAAVRIEYDGTKYADFETDSGGKLKVAASGLNFVLDPSASQLLKLRATTGEQLRLEYNGTSYCGFTVSSIGDTTIQTSSSGDIILKPGSAEVILYDGAALLTGSSNGSKIGGDAYNKLGFWDATPIVQPSHIADPTGGTTVDAEARTAINAINAMLASTGLTAAS